MSASRRQFLAYLASSRLARPAEGVIAFTDYEPGFRLEVQASRPHIQCFDLRRLHSPQTPANEFFTFHQGEAAVQRVDLSRWRLEISGSVSQFRSFSLSELLQAPAKSRAATLECSGNTDHSRLMNGLVSNGVWTGVSLPALLHSCGVQPEAREVVFFGSDIEKERKWPAGDREFAVPHGRSIAIQDAMESDALLATHLNGQPLAPEHGYPLRLILPGWYGMAQIKWLNRIVVLDRRYEGRHMARNYHSIRTQQGLVLETSISRNRLKSVVAGVAAEGEAFRISGAAWGGRDSVERVEVRIDKRPWQEAIIDRKGSLHEWCLWHFQWRDAVPGPHSVVSRAIDSRGAIQPERHELVSAREDNSQWTRQILVRNV